MQTLFLICPLQASLKANQPLTLNIQLDQQQQRWRLWSTSNQPVNKTTIKIGIFQFLKYIYILILHTLNIMYLTYTVSLCSECPFVLYVSICYITHLLVVCKYANQDWPHVWCQQRQVQHCWSTHLHVITEQFLNEILCLTHFNGNTFKRKYIIFEIWNSSSWQVSNSLQNKNCFFFFLIKDLCPYL